METKKLISLLEKPDMLQLADHESLQTVISKFPYFQAPKALYLKSLKLQGSYQYNSELRKTAAYTTDRQVLFEFITSSDFEPETSSAEIKKEDSKIDTTQSPEKLLAKIEVHQPEEIVSLPTIPMEDVVTMQLHEADSVLDPKLFTTKTQISERNLSEKDQNTSPITSSEDENNEKELHSHSSEEIIQDNEQIVPVEFKKNELHSFSEWLHLARLNPIDRKEGDNPTVKGKNTTKTNEETAPPEDSDTIKTHNSKATDSPKEKQYALIDNFLAKKPKIGPASKSGSEISILKNKTEVSPSLMTETLAKVYVSQKNYKKAIQAYNILILKNPEKSGFFADQIRAIQKLQHNT